MLKLLCSILACSLPVMSFAQDGSFVLKSAIDEEKYEYVCAEVDKEMGDCLPRIRDVQFSVENNSFVIDRDYFYSVDVKKVISNFLTTVDEAMALQGNSEMSPQQKKLKAIELLESNLLSPEFGRSAMLKMKEKTIRSIVSERGYEKLVVKNIATPVSIIDFFLSREGVEKQLVSDSVQIQEDTVYYQMYFQVEWATKKTETTLFNIVVQVIAPLESTERGNMDLKQLRAAVILTSEMDKHGNGSEIDLDKPEHELTLQVIQKHLLGFVMDSIYFGPVVKAQYTHSQKK